jgi:Tfp pilus assembly protein PilX
MTHASHSQNRSSAQRGIVLVFALITLVIMLIGAVAISRSLSSSSFALGNIGFKRDMTNQGERALQLAMNAVRAGGALSTETLRNTSLPAANYSAIMLPTNAQGIPTALLTNAGFLAVGTAANDITPSNTPDITAGTTIRYVIDRMASAAGPCTPNTCAMATERVFGGASNEPTKPPPPAQPIFRLTLKVTGPRNTVSFFQSTFTTN